MAIDSMIPIGRGQRELIIGDRQTGKTTIAMDAIINQAYLNNMDKAHTHNDWSDVVMCTYSATGQKKSTLVDMLSRFQKHKTLAYTVFCASSSDDSAALQYLSTFSACTVSE